MAGRILVIRGGAIGDFLLTLPSLRLIRESLPEAHIEILGYRHIICLAEGRYYADGVRCIEYGPLAGFFSKRSDLDPELMQYFKSFQQIISYLYDPDQIFENNLQRCGVKNLLTGSPKIASGSHAVEQLAKPLEQLALFLEDPCVRIFPGKEDRETALSLLPDMGRMRLVIHPGSGSPSKNWPVESWLRLCRQLLENHPNLELIVIGGESDTEILSTFQDHFGGVDRVRFPGTFSLPVTGALLQAAGRMIGHDTGITHLAAAADCRCILLFGPTDPEVWAPKNPGVRVLQAPEGHLANLDVDTVFAAATRHLLP